MQKIENQGFMCENCGLKVQPLNNGSYRNHCPNCLYSLHLDMKPGDRKSSCKGLMKPIDFRQHSKKGWQILHQCLKCKNNKWNIIAQNTQQEDQFITWMKNLHNS